MLSKYPGGEQIGTVGRDGAPPRASEVSWSLSHRQASRAAWASIAAAARRYSRPASRWPDVRAGVRADSIETCPA